MPLVLDRKEVLDIYSEAADRRWVLPAFNVENLTTTEAILQAVNEYGQHVGIRDLPIIIGITNTYPHRPQAVLYSHTRNWEIGLRLFLADLKVLTAPGSPFASLRVMLHLDHIRWDEDQELLEWDMRQFSSIMYDASVLPLEQNIQKTADFVAKQRENILIEGACDEISSAAGTEINNLSSPATVETFFQQTGVDIIVANLGTEHRASSGTLTYRQDLARAISQRIGPRLCLHGTSSVSTRNLVHLFDDGIRKVNIWTALERDSSPLLFQQMLENAAKIIGPDKAGKLKEQGMIGNQADCQSAISIDYFTTSYRQEVIFEKMKDIITGYLRLWYTGGQSGKQI